MHALSRSLILLAFDGAAGFCYAVAQWGMVPLYSVAGIITTKDMKFCLNFSVSFVTFVVQSDLSSGQQHAAGRLPDGENGGKRR